MSRLVVCILIFLLSLRLFKCVNISHVFTSLLWLWFKFVKRIKNTHQMPTTIVVARCIHSRRGSQTVRTHSNQTKCTYYFVAQHWSLWHLISYFFLTFLKALPIEKFENLCTIIQRNSRVQYNIEMSSTDSGSLASSDCDMHSEFFERRHLNPDLPVGNDEMEKRFILHDQISGEIQIRFRIYIHII